MIKYGILITLKICSFFTNRRLSSYDPPPADWPWHCWTRPLRGSCWVAAHSVERLGYLQAWADIPRHLRTGRRPGGFSDGFLKGFLLGFQRWNVMETNKVAHDFSDIKIAKQQAMSKSGCDTMCICLSGGMYVGIR